MSTAAEILSLALQKQTAIAKVRKSIKELDLKKLKEGFQEIDEFLKAQSKQDLEFYIKSLMLDFIKTGFVEGMKLILNYGASMNLKWVNLPLSPKKETALMLSVCMQQNGMIHFLLQQQEIEIDRQDLDQNTALRWAGKKFYHYRDNHDVAHSILQNTLIPLLKAGAKLQLSELFVLAVNMKHVDLILAIIEAPHFNVDMELEFRRRPLHYAVEFGMAKVVKALLKKGANSRAQDEEGHTALYFAAEFGADEIVKILLEHDQGATIDHRPVSNMTPLLIASYLKHPKCIEYLVSAGADVNASNSNGLTPILALLAPMPEDEIPHPAYFKKNFSDESIFNLIIKLLKAKANPNISVDLGSPLTFAISYQFKKCISILVEKSDVNLMTARGHTALQAAAEANDLATLQLLKGRVDVNQFNPKIQTSATALTRAAKKGNEACFNFILLLGADVNLQGCMTPLIAAASIGNVPMVETLLNPNNSKSSQIVDLEARDANGNTALIIAVLKGQTKIVELLLKAGADPNVKDREGYTPLMIAANFSQESIIKSLVFAKASIETVDNLGRSALFLAISNNLIATMHVFWKAGADINSSSSLPPFAFAAALGHIEVLKFYIETVNKHKRLKMDETLAMMLAKDPETIRYLRSIGTVNEPSFAKLVLARAIKSGNLTTTQSLLNVIDITEELITQERTPTEVAFAQNMTEIVLGNSLDNKARLHNLLLHKFIHQSPEQHKVEIEKQQLLHEKGDSRLYLFANGTSNKAVFALVLKHKLYIEHPSVDKKKVDLFVTQLFACAQNILFAPDGALCFSLERNKEAHQVTLSHRGLEALYKQTEKTPFSEILFECTEEGLEIKQESEVIALKLKLLEQLNQRVQVLESHREKLGVFYKLSQLGMPGFDALQLKEIEEVCVTHYNELSPLLSIVNNENFVSEMMMGNLAELQGKIKVALQNFLKSGVVTKGLQLDKAVTQLFALHQVENVKALQRKLKKESIAEKKASTELSALALDSGSAAAQEWICSFTIESETVAIQEKLKAQPRVQPRQKAAAVPAIPESLQKIEDSWTNLSQYLRPPAHTLDSTTQLMPRLKAKEGKDPFDAIVDSIQENSKDTEGFIDYRAALGALAQMLETRLELSEEWPKKIRNVIFHFEESVQKLGTEQHCIQQVKKIHQKLNAISVKEESSKLGRISIDRIESKGFLSGLLEASNHIPAFSLERAEALIQQSKVELDRLRDYIAKNQSQAMENKKLKMAVGFVLSRIGTQLNDIRDKDPKGAHPLLSTIYGKNIPVGNAYRHNDPTWQGRVEAFMAESFKTSLTPLFQAKLETNRKLETKKQHGSKASASTAVQVSQTSGSTMQPSTTAAPKVPPQTPVTVVSVKTSGSAEAVLKSKKKKKKKS